MKTDLRTDFKITDCDPILRAGPDPIAKLLRRYVPWAVRGEIFAEQLFGARPWPPQGWKVHVSATVVDAERVLSNCLPILLDYGTRFKVVKSARKLLAMNAGEYGLTQIGKFVTVYPTDQEEALNIAHLLAKATKGESGPFVPTDNIVSVGSTVYYRYGAYWPSVTANDGSMDATVFDTKYRLVKDHRLPYFIPSPTTVPDPFLEKTGPRALGSEDRPFADRFLILEALSRGTWGRVYKAIDLTSDPPEMCILKGFWHDVGMDVFGRDASDHALLEAGILASGIGQGILPGFLGGFILEGDTYLILEYLGEETLEEAALKRWRNGRRFSESELRTIATELARVCQALHGDGLILRDVKPSNLFLSAEGRIRLVDVAISYRSGVDSGPPMGMGTAGFMAPEQRGLACPSPNHDVYGWGQTVRFLATAQNPWRLSAAGRSTAGKLKRLLSARPDLTEAFCQIVEKAIEPKEPERTQDFDSILKQLRGLPSLASPPRVDAAVVTVRRKPSTEKWMDAATGIATRLCEVAEPTLDGVRWKTKSEETEEERYSPDLYDGAAGIALFLSAMANRTGTKKYRVTAERAARWLGSSTWGHGRGEVGLHVGESGVGLMYVQLASLLRAPGFLHAAMLRARRLEDLRGSTVDIVHGSAGLLLFLSFLWAATRSSWVEGLLKASGDSLLSLRSRESIESAGHLWYVDSPIPGETAEPFLGLLHGAAGIGLALLYAGNATGTTRFLEASHEVGEFLLNHAVEENGALGWPTRVDDRTIEQSAHCHGAGGIGQFMIRLWKVSGDDRFLDAGKRAAAQIIRSRRTNNSSQCHGICGDISLLLDIFWATRDDHYLSHAHILAEALMTFQSGHETNVWATNLVGHTSPDYMTGYAGVGGAFLRLAFPSFEEDLIFPFSPILC